MTDEKKKTPVVTNDILIADIMLRVTAMEKLFIDKGIFTIAELSETTEEIAKKVAKVVLEKAQSSKSVDEFVAELKGLNKKSN
jgi:hypothetical protein